MIYRYIPHSLIPWYEAFGWEIIIMTHFPHCEYSAIAWNDE